MSNKLVFYFAICLSILWTFSSNAYELATHARITEKVYERSVLVADPTLLDEFGLSDDISPFGEEYYDILGSEVRLRKQNDFEKLFMPNTEEKLTIKGWLMRGAIREDDVLYSFSNNPNPQDDPYNTNDWIKDNRPLHHFYDPVSDKGLSVPIFFGLINFEATKAPSWARGSMDVSLGDKSFTLIGDNNHV